MRPIARSDDIYLVHRDSVTDVEAAASHVGAVCDLVASHPHAHGYLAHAAARPQQLSRSEIEADFDGEQIVGGYRVAERSISTRWIADRFLAVLDSEPRIEQRLHCRVNRVVAPNGSMTPPLVIETAGGREGPFDFVVNALWEGRLAVDSTLGLRLPLTWTHRFRLSAFIRTTRPVAVPCAVIGTGPFGDVKSYDDQDFYLSWYPAGLQAEGSCVEPPPLPTLDCEARQRIISETIERLSRVIHPIRRVVPHMDDIRLEGGWVYAAGRGSLADAHSTLHRRDRIGIARIGNYFSVDTGKYSIAPWLARGIAEEILGEQGTG